jgi:hypothetical protein
LPKALESGGGTEKSGRLLRLGQYIRFPVVAIQGDPHAAEGVPARLAATFKNSRLMVLKNCHKPWIERLARDEFFRVHFL